MTDLETLLLTTQSTRRTEIIFQAVLAQAVTLGKSALWGEEELKVEAGLVGLDRADFLRLNLLDSAGIDDAALDRYNERLNQFISQDE